MKSILVVLLLTTSLAAQETKHNFWDKKNIALFSGVAAARIADMDSTWRFRATKCEYHSAQYFPDGSHLFAYSVCGPAGNEGQLSNSFVDNKPAFAAYSVGMVGLQMLTSYALHRTGHHKIERISSMIHISYIGGCAIDNYHVASGPPLPQTVTHYPDAPWLRS